MRFYGLIVLFALLALAVARGPIQRGRRGAHDGHHDVAKDAQQVVSGLAPNGTLSSNSTTTTATTTTSTTITTANDNSTATIITTEAPTVANSTTVSSS